MPPRPRQASSAGATPPVQHTRRPTYTYTYEDERGGADPSRDVDAILHSPGDNHYYLPAHHRHMQQPSTGRHHRPDDASDRSRSATATSQTPSQLVSCKSQPTSQSAHHGIVFDMKTASEGNLCALSWHNVTFSVLPSKRSSGAAAADLSGPSERRILRSVSGRSAPGELTAILGPSGAGKTTLLDVLADRNTRAPGCRFEGAVRVNGRPREPQTFAGMMNYVAPEMAFLGSFTVLETLQMAARLSLPSHVPRVTREMRVQDVIDDMGLRSCARTRVGDVFHKGISNGQRKRLSIAVELLSNPSILLLDEPTSGLDSSSAQRVMEHLAKLAREGKNVICTLHQPSSAIYDLISNVMLLSMGESVYFGPTANLLPHFFCLGYVCPMYSNPAEYVCQLVNKDFHDDLQIEPFVQAWARGDDARRLEVAIAAERTAPAHRTNRELLRVCAPSPWRQFAVLLHRNWLNNLRNPGVFWIRVFMYVMLTIMVGTMYLHSNTTLAPSAVVPLLFYVQAFLVFMSVAALPSFIEQRAVFQRERMNNSLHLLSFTMATFLAALPGILFISVISTAIVVYFAGIHSFGSFLLNLFLSLVVAESFMHVIGAAVPHYIIGIALGAGCFGMFMLCEGFMVPYSSIPSYWIWGYYLAFHTYSFQSFMYEHFTFDRDDKEAMDVLRQYDMEHVDVPKNMFILVGYVVVLQALFVFVLYVRYRRR